MGIRGILWGFWDCLQKCGKNLRKNKKTSCLLLLLLLAVRKITIHTLCDQKKKNQKNSRIKKNQESKKQKIPPFQQLDYFKMTTNQNYPEKQTKKILSRHVQTCLRLVQTCHTILTSLLQNIT